MLRHGAEGLEGDDLGVHARWHQVADAVKRVEFGPPGAHGGEFRPVRLELGPVRRDGLAPRAGRFGVKRGITVFEVGCLEFLCQRVRLPIAHQHVVARLGAGKHR